MKRALLAVSLVGALWGATAQAAVSVVFTGVSPGESLQISVGGAAAGTVSVGIYNLTIDNVATPSFCIDVVHDTSKNSQPYNFVPLATAPNSPAGPMGAAAALTIEELWGNYFGGIGSLPTAAAKNFEAAALQIAIWKAVNAGNPIPGSTVAPGDLTALAVFVRADFMLANLDATKVANLQGLVGPDSLQGYVVPEPTTMIAGALLLLPFGASTLRTFRKKQSA